MLLVVGWDGADFALAQRFRAEGRMPVLADLLSRGRAWRVRSTVPAVTFPAWTSFLTGAAPDHHGVTDFTIPREDDYGVRFANASHRVLPTFVAAMAAAGRRVGTYGMPGTWPPEGRAVFEVCGFDTPLGSTGADRAVHPPGLAAGIRARHGRLGVEGIPQGRIHQDWHERTRGQLLADVELRTRIALELLREHELDVFVVHFMESDTANHHFRHFDDAASPRHRPGPVGTLGDVYAALDRALGELLARAGADADVLLLSDHGSAGASDRVVFWNRWLADRGWLRFDGSARASAAGSWKRAALSLVPPRWQARAFAAAGGLADRLESRQRFAGIDWAGTRAFSDEVPYFPSLRLNVAGREPAGTVAPGEVPGLLDDLTRDLLEARDPFDGGPVVEGVRRREELFDGPFAGRYPDLVLELRRPDGYAYAAASSRGGLESRWLRRLEDAEASGAKGTSTAGVHSPFGMGVLVSGAVAEGEGGRLRQGKSGEGGQGEQREQREEDKQAGQQLPECSLADLGVTAMGLAGLAPLPGMSGRSLLAKVGTDAAPMPASQDHDVREYDEAGEQAVAERLRDLGYLP